MIIASDTTTVSFPGLGIDSFEMQRFVTRDLFGTGVSIAWYGLIFCCAMMAAFFIIRYNAKKREGIDLDTLLDYLIFVIPFGVIGARAMYVLTNLDYYKTFSSAIAVWNGGIAMYGSVLVGIPVIAIIARIKKQSALKVYDAIVPGLLLAQAIGRWGNFVNGEAHGGETNLPWGMAVNGQAPCHPTFLYESLITLTGFLIVMFFLYKRKKFDGEIFYFYLIWYGIGRTFVEGMRTDSLYFGPLKASQCIGVASAVIGAVLIVLAVLRLQKRRVLAVQAGDATSVSVAEEQTTDETEDTAEKPEESEAVRNGDHH